MTLSEKISSLRVENGLTRAEAARRIGVSYDAFAGWERGKIPRESQIETLARVFQTDEIELHKLREAAKQEQEELRVLCSQLEAETTEALPDAAAAAVKPTPRKEETREPVKTETAPEPVLPQIRTATDANYREAVSAAIKGLRAILGSDSNGQRHIMLAVGYVTAEIENRLFIQR